MRSLPYIRAGVGLAGRTPPEVYESLDEARQAVITALKGLAEKNPDSARVIDGVLHHLSVDPQAQRFLDFFEIDTKEYVAYIGQDRVQP
jgi:hypothetical protein